VVLELFSVRGARRATNSRRGSGDQRVGELVVQRPGNVSRIAELNVHIDEPQKWTRTRQCTLVASACGAVINGQTHERGVKFLNAASDGDSVSRAVIDNNDVKSNEVS
jgi:hypothetical protein